MMPPTTRVSLRTGRPLESTRTVPSPPVGDLEGVPGQRAERPDRAGRAATIPKMPGTHGEEAAQHLAPLDDDGRALDEGGRHGVALLGGRGQQVALLDEGALRHEVLAPGREPEAEEEQAGAEGAAEHPGVPVLPVGGTEQAEEDDGHQEEDGDDLLDPRGVPRGVAHVRVAQRGDRHGHPGARGLVVRVAHERSPIQKQMRARPPTPMSRATKPSATGPTPPSPKPPGLVGCWIRPVTYETRSAHLLVGQVAREAGHVGRTDPDGLGHLLGA